MDGVNNYTCFCPPYYTGSLTKHTTDINIWTFYFKFNNSAACFLRAQEKCVKKWRTCAPPAEAPANISLPASSPPLDPSECVQLWQNISAYQTGGCLDSDLSCCLCVCRCVCAPGYVGDDCSLDYNDCEDHRCQNRAQCVDELNGYSCVCHQGYRYEATLRFLIQPFSASIKENPVSAAVSCVRWPHLCCLCVSSPIARTTPPAWSGEDEPSASVRLSLEGRVVRN